MASDYKLNFFFWLVGSVQSLNYTYLVIISKKAGLYLHNPVQRICCFWPHSEAIKYTVSHVLLGSFALRIHCVSPIWIWMCLCEPGDGESRAFVQNSGESSGGLLLDPVGRTHTKTLLSHAYCNTHTGMCNYSCERVALKYIHPFKKKGYREHIRGGTPNNKNCLLTGQVADAVCSVLPQP